LPSPGVWTPADFGCKTFGCAAGRRAGVVASGVRGADAVDFPRVAAGVRVGALFLMLIVTPAGGLTSLTVEECAPPAP
jgi:hypothetical protein